MLICPVYITTSVRYLQGNESSSSDRQNHESADFFHSTQGLPYGHGIAVLYDLRRSGRHGRTSQLRSFPPWDSKGSLPLRVRPSRRARLRVHAETGHGRDRGAVGGARRGRKSAGRLSRPSASRLSSGRRRRRRRGISIGCRRQAELDLIRRRELTRAFLANAVPQVGRPQANAPEGHGPDVS